MRATVNHRLPPHVLLLSLDCELLRQTLQRSGKEYAVEAVETAVVLKKNSRPNRVFLSCVLNGLDALGKSQFGGGW
jgi:hypothetical protein